MENAQFAKLCSGTFQSDCLFFMAFYCTSFSLLLVLLVPIVAQTLNSTANKTGRDYPEGEEKLSKVCFLMAVDSAIVILMRSENS